MAATAARSILRSSSLRSAASKIASKPRSAPSSFHRPKPITAPRILRSPVESSFCVESLLPMHSVTASALMTSMLSVTRGGYGWLTEGIGIWVRLCVNESQDNLWPRPKLDPFKMNPNISHHPCPVR